MKALALCAATLLAACSGRPPAETAPTGEAQTIAPAAPPPASSPAAPVSLSGEWKVVAIDGADLNESYGIALRADESEIWWEPRCAGMVRGYSINGATIRFGSARSLGPPPPPVTPPPPVCAIGLPPRLADVVRALETATLIQRTASNGVELSGGGHSVLLFSQ